MVKKLTLFLISSFLVVLIFCVVYIKSTLNLNLPSVKPVKTLSVELILEKGSLVDNELISNFLILFRDKKINLTESLEGSDVIEDTYLTGKTIANSCSIPNCLQRPVSMAEISPYVWEALINVEDARFLSHLGLDPFSILRATVVNIFKGRYAQGASTITQQLVKNIFLSKEKTLWRKIKEALISIYIELLYDKDEIIETYLNNVYWGNFSGVSLKGIEAASNFYFKKNSQDLAFNESLVLIAMLKGPGLYNPFKKPNRLKKRVMQLGSKLMRDKVFVKSDLKNLEDDLDRWQEGLVSTIDTTFLKVLVSLKEEETIAFDKYVLNHSSMKLRDRISKELKTSFDFEIFRRKGDEVEYVHSYHKKNLRHQLGSILKPLIYSIILKDANLDKAVSLEKLVIPLRSGDWTPRDHLKNNETEVTIRRAIQRSLNVPLIKMSQEYGFDKLEQELKEYIPRLKTPLREYPSQLLGAVELNLFELDLLFKRFFKKVCNEKTYRAVYEALVDPTNTTISRRSKGLSGLSFFGKTGTSNNSIDNWFVFHGGMETIIIWFGFLGKREKQSFSLSGASTSFEILKSYLLRRGKRIGQFSCD